MSKKYGSVGGWLRIIATIASMYYAFNGLQSNNISSLLFAIWCMLGAILATLVLKFGDDK